MLIALPNAIGDAATNMAIDAALLAHMPVGLAAFRHYGGKNQPPRLAIHNNTTK